MTGCPSRQELEEMLSGQLPEAAEQRLFAHVDRCPFCQVTLETLTACKTINQDPGRQSAGAGDRPSDSCLQRLKAIPTVSWLPEEQAQPFAAGDGTGHATTRSDSSFPRPAPLPCEVGQYVILRELGRGGMGVVYLAEQVQLKRRVALKMILSGGYADAMELARFRSEAEAVARLQHPNIVQIHEVGEHKGLPWFSLEYVSGGSLAEQLDGTPQPPRDAARFLQILARAVHYAHQQGIVHRDLKPGNVLLAQNPKSEIRNPQQIRNTKEENPKQESAAVSDLGDSDLGIVSDFGFRISDLVPKITDFGLAKQLEGGASATQPGTILGTPSYMAPEQAGGSSCDVGPATDVYALGSMLYELLTGRPPFHAGSALETVQLVLHQEPVPPARLQPKVPRDLEIICLTCLQKDPHRRYVRAEDLAEDLRRFLGNEAILARPAGKVERTLKWAKRRPALAALVGVIVLAVAALLGAWGWFTLELREERDYARKENERAEINFQRAQRAVDEMLTEVADETLVHEPRMEKKRRALLEKALAFYQEFLGEKGDDARVRQKTALAYKKVADILRLLGEPQRAKAAYREAIGLLGPLAEANPESRSYRRQLADSYNWYGDLLRTTSRPRQAMQAFDNARQLQLTLVQERPNNSGYRKDLARSHYNLGIVLAEVNRPQDAEKAFDQAIALLEDGMPLPARHLPAIRQELARGYLNLGPVLRLTGQETRAGTAYARAIRILQGLSKDHPLVPDYRYELGVACNNRGNYSAGRHRGQPKNQPFLDAAVKDHRRALTLFAELAADFPGVPVYRREQANCLNSLGAVQVQRKDEDGALDSWKRARVIWKQLVAEGPGVPDLEGDLGLTLGNIGWLLSHQKQWAEARTQLEQAVAHVRAALEPNPRNPSYLAALRNQYRDLANTLLHLQDHAAAAKTAQALTLLYHPTRDDYFQAGSCLARCMALADEDLSLPAPGRSRLASQYGDQAIACLRQGLARGYNPLESLKKDPTFALLRRHAEYSKLLADIKSKHRPTTK
jgi:serine/threonine protein kinase/Tfp pilus assembly protein PilF